MLVKLEDPVVLSRAVELISELVTEVRLKVSEFGMSITAMDPANVAMISFKLPKAAFSKYETDTDVLGVNLDNLKKVLKRCGPKSALTIEKQDNMLNILIEDRVRRNFSLGLIEIESEDKSMPDLEYSSKVIVNSADFIASIEDCAVVADACSFVIKDNTFTIESKGSTDSAMSEFSGDEAEIHAENCKARYSLEYLQKFVKGSKLAEKTTLNFATDHPLRMDIRTPSTEMSFLLAPRVEIED